MLLTCLLPLACVLCEGLGQMCPLLHTQSPDECLELISGMTVGARIGCPTARCWHLWGPNGLTKCWVREFQYFRNPGASIARNRNVNQMGIPLLSPAQ